MVSQQLLLSSDINTLVSKETNLKRWINWTLWKFYLGSAGVPFPPSLVWEKTVFLDSYFLTFLSYTMRSQHLHSDLWLRLSLKHMGNQPVNFIKNKPEGLWVFLMTRNRPVWGHLYAWSLD